MSYGRTTKHATDHQYAPGQPCPACDEQIARETGLLTEALKTTISAAVSAAGYIFTGDKDELHAWATGWAMAALSSQPLSGFSYDFRNGVRLLTGDIVAWVSAGMPE